MGCYKDKARGEVKYSEQCLPKGCAQCVLDTCIVSQHPSLVLCEFAVDYLNSLCAFHI